MRAAIYSRVSTEQQADEGWSLGEQERRCREHIEREGWTYVKTFAEAGCPASSAADRRWTGCVPRSMTSTWS